MWNSGPHREKLFKICSYSCLSGQIFNRPHILKCMFQVWRSWPHEEELSQAGDEKDKALSRVYALPAPEAKDDPRVVTGTFLVNGIYASVLFDTGAFDSYVTTEFGALFDKVPELLDASFDLIVATGQTAVVDRIYRDCTLVLAENIFKIDLMPAPLVHFDVIVGMDFLDSVGADISCHLKHVRIPRENGETLTVECDRRGSKLNIISCIQASKYLLKDCFAILAHVRDTEVEEKRLEDVPVVRDFPEVFPEELPGLPPKRQVEFDIDLVPGAAPIARAPYRLAPSEMKELSDQLQELLDKGFICPSSSPWGAPVLFVKKKDGSMRMCIDYREL